MQSVCASAHVCGSVCVCVCVCVCVGDVLFRASVRVCVRERERAPSLRVICIHEKTTWTEKHPSVKAKEGKISFTGRLQIQTTFWLKHSQFCAHRMLVIYFCAIYFLPSINIWVLHVVLFQTRTFACLQIKTWINFKVKWLSPTLKIICTNTVSLCG